MLDINSVEVSEYGDGVVDATTGELVKIQDAPLPVSYELATKALAECTRLDECKDWANKAEALASYARQSKDDRLRKMAIRIQARAIRRCGELLREIESGQGTRTDKLHDGAVTKSTRLVRAHDQRSTESQNRGTPRYGRRLSPARRRTGALRPRAPRHRLPQGRLTMAAPLDISALIRRRIACERAVMETREQIRRRRVYRLSSEKTAR